MKKIIIICILIFIPFVVNAKEFKMEWQKNYGVELSDNFSKIKTDSEGNLIVTGSMGSSNILATPPIYDSRKVMVKYDIHGNEIWKNILSGENFSASYYDFVVTPKDEILAYGYIDSGQINGKPMLGKNDALLVKYDKDGNVKFTKTFNGTKYSYVNNVYCFEDGTYAVLIHTDSTDMQGVDNKGEDDGVIMVFSENDELIWMNTFGGNKDEFLKMIFKLDTKEYIVLGSTKSTDIDGLTNNGDQDLLMLKYSETGELLWKKNFGGNKYDVIQQAYMTNNNEIVAVGYTYSTNIQNNPNNGQIDFSFYKFDLNGNLIIEKIWGGNSYDTISYSKINDNDEIYLVGATTSTNIEGITSKGSKDIYLAKLDNNGNIIWQKILGGDGSDSANDIIITPKEEIIVVGITYSKEFEGLQGNDKTDAIFVQLDKDGQILWKTLYAGNELDSFSSCTFTKTNNIVVVGSVSSTDIEGMPNVGDVDSLMVKYYMKYDYEVKQTENGTTNVIQKDNLGIITPNPNEGYEVNKIIVRDVDGNVLGVEVTKMEDGTYSFPLSDDVNIEVLFREKIENPKTGVFDYISFIMVGLLISFVGYVSISYNNKFQL